MSLVLSELYVSLCPALLGRFKEHDQHVKQHVLAAVADWVRSTGEAAQADSSFSTSSSADDQPMSDASALSSALSTQLGSIVSACLAQLRVFSSSSSASAAESTARLFGILSELVSAAPAGALDSHLPVLLPLLLQTVGQQQSAQQASKVDAVTLLRALIERGGDSNSAGSGSDALTSGASGIALVQSIVSTLSTAVASTPFVRFKSEVLLTVSALLVRLGSSRSLSREQLTPSVLPAIYALVFSTLQLNDVDTELKAAALLAWANLFYYFAPELQQQQQGGSSSKLSEGMHIVTTQRLSNELTRLASLRALTRLASAPASHGLDVASYLLAPSSGASDSAAASSRPLDELTALLRKDNPLLQLETVHTLLAALDSLHASKGAAGAVAAAATWNQAQLSVLLREAAAHVSDSDLNLSNALLQLLATLCRLAPSALPLSSSPQAVSDADALLGKLLHFLRSPLLQVQNLRTLRELFRTLMQLQYPAGGKAPAAACNPHLSFAFLFDAIARSVQAQGGAGATGAQQQQQQQQQQVQHAAPSQASLSHAAQMVGSGLLLHIPGSEQAPVLQRLVDMVRGPSSASLSESMQQFALLVLGELGRHVYLGALHPQLSEGLFFACFASDSESLRTAAALAFGAVTLGNIAHNLPTLLAQLAEAQTAAASDAAHTRRLLLLSSLRELITHIATGEHPVSRMGGDAAAAAATAAAAGESAHPHSSPPAAFRSFIPQLLPLLWRSADDREESVRALVSEVLGGVLIIDSASALPEMVARLTANPSPHVKSVVGTALRHALTQQQQQAAASSSALTSHAHTHAPSLDMALLAKHIPAFLQLLRDADLSVRRQAILTVSALVHAQQPLAEGGARSAPGVTLLDEQAFTAVILPTLSTRIQTRRWWCAKSPCYRAGAGEPRAAQGSTVFWRQPDRPDKPTTSTQMSAHARQTAHRQATSAAYFLGGPLAHAVEGTSSCALCIMRFSMRV